MGVSNWARVMDDISTHRDVVLYVPSDWNYTVQARWWKYEAEPIEEGLIRGQGWRVLHASADSGGHERIWSHYSWQGEDPLWIFKQMANAQEDTFFESYRESLESLVDKAERSWQGHTEQAAEKLNHRNRLKSMLARLG